MRKQSRAAWVMFRFRIASYNVHGCVGIDARHKPERVVALLLDLDADIVALQEVFTAPPRLYAVSEYQPDNFLQRLRDHYIVIAGPTLHRRKRHFGNVLLTRFKAEHVELLDISVGRHEPRGLIDARLRIGDRDVRCFATHFGLRHRERCLQATLLAHRLGDGDAAHALVLGDFNEWRRPAPSLSALDERGLTATREATFPSPLPLLPLDRIWVGSGFVVERIFVPRNRATICASDHLPVVMDVAVVPGKEAVPG